MFVTRVTNRSLLYSPLGLRARRSGRDFGSDLRAVARLSGLWIMGARGQRRFCRDCNRHRGSKIAKSVRTRIRRPLLLSGVLLHGAGTHGGTPRMRVFRPRQRYESSHKRRLSATATTHARDPHDDHDTRHDTNEGARDALDFINTRLGNSFPVRPVRRKGRTRETDDLLLEK